ncbi:hypothetical protein F2Q69_00006601 [Brassica cretica]|uniref:Uncharacterized protein n=1 Tax=Brassica cretica TaxID=69181 RepID=A0A8S9P952_BRACR|nr:hypothetical protein F2Q69_00006601 [Brassica cretica]
MRGGMDLNQVSKSKTRRIQVIMIKRRHRKLKTLIRLVEMSMECLLVQKKRKLSLVEMSKESRRVQKKNKFKTRRSKLKIRFNL